MSKICKKITTIKDLLQENSEIEKRKHEYQIQVWLNFNIVKTP